MEIQSTPVKRAIRKKKGRPIPTQSIVRDVSFALLWTFNICAYRASQKSVSKTSVITVILYLETTLYFSTPMYLWCQDPPSSISSVGLKVSRSSPMLTGFIRDTASHLPSRNCRQNDRWACHDYALHFSKSKKLSPPKVEERQKRIRPDITPSVCERWFDAIPDLIEKGGTYIEGQPQLGKSIDLKPCRYLYTFR